MKNTFGIVVIFAILMIMYLPANLLRAAKSEEAELNGKILEAIVDYAGEAAMASCIEENIGTEYSDLDSIIFTPEHALDTFTTSLCISYDIAVSEENKAMIANAIPAMVLVTNDGYYIAQQQEIDSEATLELVWGIKKPYLIDIGTSTLYNVKLSKSSGYAINKNNYTYTLVKDTSSFPSDEITYQQINLAINKDVNLALARYCEHFNETAMESFYLPVSNSVSGVNRIERPTLIVLLHNLTIAGMKIQDYISISGMNVVKKDYCVGWTLNGVKYYTYKELTGSNASLAKDNGVVFGSAAEAAAAGYIPYLADFS